MSEILWNIGEKTQVTIVLPGDNPHVVHSHSYFQDSVTEKVYWVLIKSIEIRTQFFFQLYLFELTQLEDVQIFLKRHLHFVSLIF